MLPAATAAVYQIQALLVTEIPINEKDNIINTYNAILKQFSEKGFDCSELNSAVGEYISNRKDPYIYAPDLTLFDGIIYKNDPFYYTGISETEKYLKENPEFFRVILDKYFIQNPYSKIVISRKWKQIARIRRYAVTKF